MLRLAGAACTGVTAIGFVILIRTTAAVAVATWLTVATIALAGSALRAMHPAVPDGLSLPDPEPLPIRGELVDRTDDLRVVVLSSGGER